VTALCIARPTFFVERKTGVAGDRSSLKEELDTFRESVREGSLY